MNSTKKMIKILNKYDIKITNNEGFYLNVADIVNNISEKWNMISQEDKDNLLGFMVLEV